VHRHGSQLVGSHQRPSSASLLPPLPSTLPPFLLCARRSSGTCAPCRRRSCPSVRPRRPPAPLPDSCSPRSPPGHNPRLGAPGGAGVSRGPLRREESRLRGVSEPCRHRLHRRPLRLRRHRPGPPRPPQDAHPTPPTRSSSAACRAQRRACTPCSWTASGSTPWTSRTTGCSCTTTSLLAGWPGLGLSTVSSAGVDLSVMELSSGDPTAIKATSGSMRSSADHGRRRGSSPDIAPRSRPYARGAHERAEARNRRCAA
jgi:hypothetical protein